MERFIINGLKDNNRMSTQDLLQLIQEKIKAGVTDFEVNACGQHDIGGASWSREGKYLNFLVRNPGQRVGAMGMAGTTITVEGSVPADTGWLNSGAEIIIKGDCGDTASHCSASVEIYVAGRVGARSGALMKHDPKFKTPEFWVLKNTGSFSFEFMGGGIAVVCGLDCEDLPSVLGERSCVGMVGGVIYVRGKINDIDTCVKVESLDKNDIEFLNSGLKRFLDKIEMQEKLHYLTNWTEWKKILPKSKTTKQTNKTVKEFHKENWIKGGLFGEFMQDIGDVNELCGVGNSRVRFPKWDKDICIDCGMCAKKCPQNAILKSNSEYISLDNKCIGCGICSAVCPKNAWSMQNNNLEIGDN